MSDNQEQNPNHRNRKNKAVTKEHNEDAYEITFDDEILDDEGFSDEEITDTSNDVNELQVKLQEKSDEFDVLQNRFLRGQADLENYRKRKDKETREAIEFANKGLLTQLLEIVDNFERALSNSVKEKDNTTLIEGIRLIFLQFKAFLKRYGVTKIESLGKTFDPNYHEAMGVLPSDIPEGTIIEELQMGYLMNSKVIRPAKVLVSSGAGNPSKDNTS